jgi:hypothetical protein
LQVALIAVRASIADNQMLKKIIQGIVADGVDKVWG